MTEEKEFDYENYIKRRLREIDDLDERRYAKELLLGSFGSWQHGQRQSIKRWNSGSGKIWIIHGRGSRPL